MFQSNSLRFRVVFFYTLYGAVLSIFVSVAGYFVLQHSGHRLMDEALRAELEDSVERHARDLVFVPPNTITIKGYVWPSRDPAQSIPKELDGLSVGSHNISIDEVDYRALIEDRNGSRYFMLFDTELQHQRERGFRLWMVLFGVFTILASGLGGFFMAGNIIAPVTRLAEQVSYAEPKDVHLSLSKLSRDDEVGNLARAFDLYLHRLKTVVERESFFLADMSHELRTPLAVILGTAEVLEQDTTLSHKQRERIERIKRAVQEMIEQTNALLLMARDYATSAETQTCSLAEVVRNSIERHKILIGGRVVELITEVNNDSNLNAERPLLDILVGNLLRNALFHTDSGQIMLRLEPDQLVVQDTGTGMSEDELARAQERYFKSSNSSGAGIGLSLVRRICDRYGWRLSIESTVGLGTTVTVSFLV